MAKAAVAFVCEECGASHPKWMGRCGSCGAWDALRERQAAARHVAGAAKTWTGAGGGFTTLDKARGQDAACLSTGMAELDRVLGGGVMPGSVVLLGGEPGVGKSTLLLQLAGALQHSGVVYISGEESASQLSRRAERLGVNSTDNLRVWAGNDLGAALAALEGSRPGCVIVDSIQTVHLPHLDNSMGSATQVRECAAALTRMAKETGTAVFLIGHLTKDGALAGPRVLEHMVDVVLYFEGDSSGLFRVIRAFKNRHGSASELGIFRMGGKGLESVDNPSELFLTLRRDPVPGTCVFSSMEGDRPLLAELQALAEDTPSPNPRRFASGIDVNRVQMLLAVLNRHGHLPAFDLNLYVKVVGGLRLQEAAADLAVLLAVASSLRNRPLPSDLAAFGEVGLAGEVRPVPRAKERCLEAARQGFRTVVLPHGREGVCEVPGLRLVPVQTVGQALQALWP